MRLILLGNAGGTIATLSFIGTMVSVSDDNKFDKGSFVVLILFLFGLMGGWLSRTAEWNIASAEIEAANTKNINFRNKAMARRIKWEKVLNWSINHAFTMLGMGVLFGLGQLWLLTR